MRDIEEKYPDLDARISNESAGEMINRINKKFKDQ